MTGFGQLTVFTVIRIRFYLVRHIFSEDSVFRDPIPVKSPLLAQSADIAASKTHSLKSPTMRKAQEPEAGFTWQMRLWDIFQSSCTRQKPTSREKSLVKSGLLEVGIRPIIIQTCQAGYLGMSADRKPQELIGRGGEEAGVKRFCYPKSTCQGT
ncbi:unnamed protein product [Protopolystoma xenopodis]|uniref:Uncharacterized protein n=1 Tax=Protopolystoma xenopodis TaxID=117903 RepID=A0A3S5FBZ5_9PLAT|nr:unnamed protein product [Protopolystoma xenopodis]